MSAGQCAGTAVPFGRGESRGGSILPYGQRGAAGGEPSLSDPERLPRGIQDAARGHGSRPDSRESGRDPV